MEYEVGSSRILLHPKNDPSDGGIPYLKSIPGIIRVFPVLLGLLSLILVLLGFSDEYPYSEDENQDVHIPNLYERKRQPWLKLTPGGRYTSFEDYYGAGYANERVNVIQLVCIVICLVLSTFHLLLLVISPECHRGSKQRGWNRFLNLSIAILQCIGFLNGIFGLLLFRSYCCHVEFSGSERHQSELEGYFREPCMCYITTEGDYNTYSTFYFHDTPDNIVLSSALPHHYIPHVIALCFMGINTSLYLFASIWI